MHIQNPLQQARRDAIYSTKELWRSSRNEITIFLFLAIIEIVLRSIVVQELAFLAVKVTFGVLGFSLFILLCIQHKRIEINVFIAAWFILLEFAIIFGAKFICYLIW